VSTEQMMLCDLVLHGTDEESSSGGTLDVCGTAGSVWEP